MRNGKKVGEDDRIKVISEGNSRKLVIDKVIDKDEGEYEFRIRFFFFYLNVLGFMWFLFDFIWTCK